MAAPLLPLLWHFDLSATSIADFSSSPPVQQNYSSLKSYQQWDYFYFLPFCFSFIRADSSTPAHSGHHHHQWYMMHWLLIHPDLRHRRRCISDYVTVSRKLVPDFYQYRCSRDMINADFHHLSSLSKTTITHISS